MPARSVRRAATVAGYAIPTAAPLYVDSDDNALKLIPAGTGTTELAVCLAATASGFRMAVGTGTLVTGALTVATGLTTILGFALTNTDKPTGTGAASDQLLAGVVTTGSIAVTAYSISSVTGATIAADTSTGAFTWIAVGT